MAIGLNIKWELIMAEFIMMLIRHTKITFKRYPALISSFLMGGIICSIIFFALFTQINAGEENKISNNNMIAHAGGMIDGHIYTNSKDAVLSSLQKGYKYIELDLGFTKDSVLVFYHNVKDLNKMTGTDVDDMQDAPLFSDYIQKKIYGRYSTLTMTDLDSIRHQTSFTLVLDKISDCKILCKYFKYNRSAIMVEAFSLEDFFQLKRAGFTPMLSCYHLGYRGEYGLPKFS